MELYFSIIKHILLASKSIVKAKVDVGSPEFFDKTELFDDAVSELHRFFTRNNEMIDAIIKNVDSSKLKFGITRDQAYDMAMVLEDIRNNDHNNKNIIDFKKKRFKLTRDILNRLAGAGFDVGARNKEGGLITLAIHHLKMSLENIKKLYDQINKEINNLRAFVKKEGLHYQVDKMLESGKMKPENVTFIKTLMDERGFAKLLEDKNTILYKVKEKNDLLLDYFKDLGLSMSRVKTVIGELYPEITYPNSNVTKVLKSVPYKHDMGSIGLGNTLIGITKDDDDLIDMPKDYKDMVNKLKRPFQFPVKFTNY